MHIRLRISTVVKPMVLSEGATMEHHVVLFLMAAEDTKHLYQDKERTAFVTVFSIGKLLFSWFFPLATRLACQDQRLPLKPGSLFGSLPTRACFLLPSIVRFSAALLKSLPSHGGRDGQERRFIDTPRHRSKEKKAVFVKVEPVMGGSRYNI